VNPSAIAGLGAVVGGRRVLAAKLRPDRSKTQIKPSAGLQIPVSGKCQRQGTRALIN